MEDFLKEIIVPILVIAIAVAVFFGLGWLIYERFKVIGLQNYYSNQCSVLCGDKKYQREDLECYCRNGNDWIFKSKLKEVEGK